MFGRHSDVVREQRHERHGEQRAKEGADGIQRLAQPVSRPAQLGRRDVRHQRIARRAANAFADPIDEARGKHPADVDASGKIGFVIP